ncbi:uncharacterized protein LOC144451716 [Glandiceps talaboti]
MSSKLCWNVEYAWEECRRSLSNMGMKPSFPVYVEPILYEPQDHFTSTGRRRVVNNRKMVVKYHLTEFQKINNQIYQDVVTQRRMTNFPKRKLHRVDFRKLHQKYPQWALENLSEFRVEFMAFDTDQDGLLNFEECCNTLTQLGNDSSHQVRDRLFYENVSMDFPEHVDFEEFVNMCDKLAKLPPERESVQVQLIETTEKNSVSSEKATGSAIDVNNYDEQSEENKEIS